MRREGEKTPMQVFEGLLDQAFAPYGRIVLPEGIVPGSGLFDAVRMTFKKALLLACYYIIHDQPEVAARYELLLEQYLNGRAVVGFDRTWRPIVFVK